MIDCLTTWCVRMSIVLTFHVSRDFINWPVEFCLVMLCQLSWELGVILLLLVDITDETVVWLLLVYGSCEVLLY